MTKELLEQCDLAEQIPAKDLQIGIKPNLVSPTEASWGATTHPEIVAGIIEYLQEKGFAKIAILEGSWVGRTKPQKPMNFVGYREDFRKIPGSFRGICRRTQAWTEIAAAWI